MAKAVLLQLRLGAHVTAIQSQRKLFQIVNHFFESFIGSEPEKFPDYFEFQIWLKENTNILNRFEKSYEEFSKNIFNYYSESKLTNFEAAKKMAGLKFVLGGTSNFSITNFESVRKTLLYVDTVLIPDPILPWFEVERKEERFKFIKLTLDCYCLLKLKPFIENDFPVPPIVIFQSWEKSLSEKDKETQQSILGLSTNIVSRSLNKGFSSFTELHEFVRKNPGDLLKAMDRDHLFVSPYGKIDDPIGVQIQGYKKYVQTYRSGEFVKLMEKKTDAEIALLAFLERVDPQFHLIENADELGAGPLFSLDVHWHYFKICAGQSERTLIDGGRYSKETAKKVEAINQPNLSWLGNVSVEDLVILRKQNSNNEFRKKLESNLNLLKDADLENIEKVASEVGLALTSLMAEHRNEISRIQEKFQLDHKRTLFIACLTPAALFFPALAPAIGPLPLLGAAGKYAWDKIKEGHEISGAARSLMGVLAKAEAEE
jgi:hypothetical protein